MFKNIEKEDLLKTNEGDAIKVKAQAENTWQMLTVQEKEQFNLIVTIRDRNVCFCNEKMESLWLHVIPAIAGTITSA